MEQENITAWFSYSGAQHELVCQICEQLKPANADVIVKDLGSALKPGEQALKHIRLVPKRYRLDSEAGSGQAPVYRLAPGCSIYELIFDIANNPLRILVLSESYFKSQHCLNEFCLSLCASYYNNTRRPLLILSGFADNSRVLTDGTFEFADPDNPGQSKTQTLLQALQQTLTSLRQSQVANWRGFSLTDDFSEQLPSLLEDYANQLNMPASHSITADDAANLAAAIYRYALSCLSGIDTQKHNKLVNELYDNWAEDEFCRRLKEKIIHNGDSDPFLQITNIRHAQSYLSQIHKTLKANRSLLKEEDSQPRVYHLYGLVMLKLLRPVGASLLSALGNTSTLIDVTVEDDSQANLQNSIHASLSFCTASGLPPRMNHDMQARTINDDKMYGVYFPKKLSISGTCDTEAYNALKALGKYLAPYDNPPPDDQLRDSNHAEHKLYVGYIRTGLELIEYGEYGLLALSESQHRGENGYFPLLEQLESIINKDYPQEKLNIPCVVLRSERSAEGEFKTHILFPKQTFQSFRRQLQDISALYAPNTKTS